MGKRRENLIFIVGPNVLSQIQIKFNVILLELEHEVRHDGDELVRT